MMSWILCSESLVSMATCRFGYGGTLGCSMNRRMDMLNRLRLLGPMAVRECLPSGGKPCILE